MQVPTKQASEVDVYLCEYWKLKDEQIKRIEYRDHLVHVHLALVGAAMSWGFTHDDQRVFLLVPWICVIIGWAYIVNDDLISGIGRYIRVRLRERVENAVTASGSSLFGWENEHRSDDRRSERKILQLLVDVLTFVLSGALAVVVYCWQNPMSRSLQVFIGLELLLLFALGVLLYRYADLAVESTGSDESNTRRKVLEPKSSESTDS
jgi:hypothetical protein